MLFRAKEEAKAFLEKRYPDHDFCWQEKGRRLWGLCPAHPDQNIGNFGIYFDRKANGWGFYCFACGFSHHQFKKLSIFQHDIEIFVNDLKDQVESESQLGYRYLARRIPDLDYYKDILFKQFEVGYHFYSRKFADEFSKAFKDKVINIDDLWEPSEKDQNYNFEWLVFVYRSLKGQATSLKFRNIAIDKNSLRWKQHGIKTVKLADEVGIFGYRNLFAEAPVLIIVEGEFDAITTTLLTELKYPAVAVSGASGFNKSKIMQIIKHKAVKDKVIVIQPDWDQAGETALNQFVDELPESILKGYKLYTLPKPDENVKDLDEYLRDEPDTAIEKIEELFKNAISLTELRERKGEEEKEKLAKLCSLYPQEIQKALGVQIQKQEFIDVTLRDWNETIQEPEKILAGIVKGEVGMLVAPGDTGKSYFALYLSLLTSSTIEFEDPFCTAHGKRIVYINHEDRPAEFVRRQRYIVSSIKNILLQNNIVIQEQEIIDSYKENFFAKVPQNTFFLFKERKGELTLIRENFKKLEELVENKDALVIDTWSRTALISDVSNQIAAEAIAELEEFAKKQNIAILLLHHTSKVANIEKRIGTDAIRGASAQYYNIKYIIQMQNLKSLNIQAFGNERLKNFLGGIQDKERCLLVYEGKNNYVQKRAYVYIKDKDTGAPHCISEEFKIYI